VSSYERSIVDVFISKSMHLFKNCNLNLKKEKRKFELTFDLRDKAFFLNKLKIKLNICR